MDDIQYKLLRKSILDDGVRVDGRKVDEIRPITCEVNVLPTPHGSALFTRGETQSLAVCTLGTAMDEQSYDDIDGDRSEHFILTITSHHTQLVKLVSLQLAAAKLVTVTWLAAHLLQWFQAAKSSHTQSA